MPRSSKPIPEPAQTGDGLSGPLPAIGGPDKRGAGGAVDLVLGRYCLDPGRYTFTLDPDHDGTRADFHHVDVLVFRLDGSGNGPDLRLIRTGYTTAADRLNPRRLLMGVASGSQQLLEPFQCGCAAEGRSARRR